MTKGVRVAAAGAALAVSVVLLQSSLASAGPGDPGRGHDDGGVVLEFDVTFSPTDYTDLAEEGPSPADLITFNDVLLVDGVQVGHQVGSCVVVDVTAGPVASCTGVITLDGEGTIAFSLENAPPPRKTLAVTGGSGEFTGVDGDGVLVENGDGTETTGGTGTLTLTLDHD